MKNDQKFQKLASKNSSSIETKPQTPSPSYLISQKDFTTKIRNPINNQLKSHKFPISTQYPEQKTPHLTSSKFFQTSPNQVVHGFRTIAR
jgi:hypothetical protein